MQTVVQHIPPTAPLAAATAILAEHPEVRSYYDAMPRALKSRTRSGLMNLGYARDVVEAVIPLNAPGKQKYKGVFDLLSTPGRNAIVAALGPPGGDIALIEWTPETASLAADTLIAKYETNVVSAVCALKGFRHGLYKLLQLDPAVPAKQQPIIAATLRPELTKRANAIGAESTRQRGETGITVPEPYERISALVERVQAFVAGGACTGQTAADLLVSLSARPGEAETLEIGDRGAVKGVLKKGNLEEQFNLVSALGEQLARQFLELWRARPIAERRRAMKELHPLVAIWGLQRRDLRAVGAALAVRASILAGGAATVQTARTVHRAALRHAEPLATPQQNYERVLDDGPQIAARFAEATPEQRAAILKILGQ